MPWLVVFVEWIKKLREKFRWWRLKRSFRRLGESASRTEVAMRGCGEAFKVVGDLLREEFIAAQERDPGLLEAVLRARETDPEIGWLDVAAVREGC